MLLLKRRNCEWLLKTYLEGHWVGSSINGFSKEDIPWYMFTYDYNLLEKTVTVNLRQQGEVFYFPLEIVLHENGLKRVQQVFVKEEESSFTFAYNKTPEWVQVNADHVVLGDFIENKTQRTYMYQYKHATHIADRKEALLALSKHQEDKEVFELLVSALDDAYAPLQIIALEQIDLSYKYSKRQVIKKIESLAKSSQNNAVKAAAIKLLGKLVYFDYQYFFEKSVDSPSNAVKGSALEALYYLDAKSAMDKAKFLPSSVKESIAIPLTKLYIEAKETSEMAFVAKYIVQGLYLSNNNKTKELYKNAFDMGGGTSNNVSSNNEFGQRPRCQRTRIPQLQLPFRGDSHAQRNRLRAGKTSEFTRKKNW